MKFNSRFGFWVLFVCAFGFGAQCILTYVLFDRLTFEELAESIRNPYWVANSDLYDGISSNVVYYKVLDIYYRLTGFHLFAAKEFRLLLSFVSIAVIGFFLYRSNCPRVPAILALSGFLLSPTLLYFGTHQASFGIDLHGFPLVAICWLGSLHFRGWVSLLLLFISGFLAVLLAAMFPPGLFYLPAIILLDTLVRTQGVIWMKSNLKLISKRLCVFGSGLLCGLAVPFLLVDQPGDLLFDPNTQAGLFRGGGKLSLHPGAFVNSLMRSFEDLFILGDSYQFYLPHPEFGTPAALISVVALIFILFSRLWSLKITSLEQALLKVRQPGAQVALFAVILLLTFLFIGHLSPNLPGLRRSAGMLIGFYLLYFTALEICLNRFPFRSSLLRWGVLFALCILPVSHIVQLSGNIRELSGLSTDAYPDWLEVEPSATESLEVLYTDILNGRYLRCDEVPAGCRYSVPFAALQLTHRSRAGNDPDLPVYAEDPRTNTVVRVQRSLWEDHYWLH